MLKQRQRQRCEKYNVCTFLKSIGGFGEGNTYRKIRFNAKKAGKDTVCKKGDIGDTSRPPMTEKRRQRQEVRETTRVPKTGSGCNLLAATGCQSLFYTPFLKEGKRSAEEQSG